MMIILLAVLIGGIVFSVQYFRRRDAGRDVVSGSFRNEGASEILEKRYANGELNREEYLVMKVDLEKSGAST